MEDSERETIGAAGPKTIGPYEIREKIAEGGMGLVLKGWDPELHRFVAIKVLKSGVLASDKEVKRFRHEARLAAALRHPNIVTVYGFGRHEGTYYLAMDFIDGESLDAVIKSRRMNPAWAVSIVGQVARALHYAHRRGVVHRDIKPMNIILDGEQRPMVADFGLALTEQPDEMSRMTSTGTVLGTPYYLSPEQAEGRIRDIDHRTDIYSLGVVLYQMLTQTPPFSADNLFGLLKKIINEDPVRPSAFGAKVTPELETACLKALAKDPDKRFQTSELFAAALESLPAQSAETGENFTLTDGDAPKAAPAAAEPEAGGSVTFEREELELGETFKPTSPAAQKSRFDRELSELEKLRFKITGALKTEDYERTERMLQRYLEIAPGDREKLELLEKLPEMMAARDRRARELKRDNSAIACRELAGQERWAEALRAFTDHLEAFGPEGVKEDFLKALAAAVKPLCKRGERFIIELALGKAARLLGSDERLDAVRAQLPAKPPPRSGKAKKAGKARRYSLAVPAALAALVLLGLAGALAYRQSSPRQTAAEREQLAGERRGAIAARDRYQARIAGLEPAAGDEGGEIWRQAAAGANEAQLRFAAGDFPAAAAGYDRARELIEGAPPARTVVRIREPDLPETSVIVYEGDTPIGRAGEELSLGAFARHELSVMAPGCAEAVLPLVVRDPAGLPAEFSVNLDRLRFPAGLRVVPRPSRPSLAGLAAGSGEARAKQWAESRRQKLPLEAVNTIGLRFRLIPAGEFQMGSPDGEPGRNDDETRHPVTLTGAFYLGATEVTQGQWQTVMGDNPSRFQNHENQVNLPVETVSWNDCREFIRRLNARENLVPGTGTGVYRLPTEAEWEYACRAGTGTGFYSGECTRAEKGLEPALDGIGWYEENSNHGTDPVGEKRPNAWGLYDLSGNVWEWCRDWHAPYPEAGVSEDPAGPEAGTTRVFRGGSWYSHAPDCRSASRAAYEPDYSSRSLGFRLVRTFE